MSGHLAQGGTMLLLDADERPLRDVIATVARIVDDRFDTHVAQHPVGVVRTREIIRWTSGNCPFGANAPLGVSDGTQMHLRSWLFDAVALFLRGEVSTGNPVVAGFEASAIRQAVLGLRVLIHERIHSAQAERGATSATGARRVILEGSTQLQTDALLPEILSALGWADLDPRVVSSPHSPVYAAETAAVATLLMWASEPGRLDPRRLLMDITRVAWSAQGPLTLLRAWDTDRATTEPIDRLPLSKIAWGFEPLGAIDAPKRLPSGENAVDATVARGLGTACALRAIDAVEQRVAEHRALVSRTYHHRPGAHAMRRAETVD